MSAWAYYTMRANASSQGPEVPLDKARQLWSHQFSQPHLNSRPSPYHHRQQSEDGSQTALSSWGSLNSWGSGWLARAAETAQIKWWHYMTGKIGGLDFEREAEENEYRRAERFVAIAEGRPYRYDS